LLECEVVLFGGGEEHVVVDVDLLELGLGWVQGRYCPVYDFLRAFDCRLDIFHVELDFKFLLVCFLDKILGGHCLFGQE
jgi:hypothetical protein